MNHRYILSEVGSCGDRPHTYRTTMRPDRCGDGGLQRRSYNPLGIPQIWLSVVARVSHKMQGTMTSNGDANSLSITSACVTVD